MKIKLFLSVIIISVLHGFTKSKAQLNKNLSNLNAPTAVNQNLLPNTNNTKDLGSGQLGWRDIYISNQLYLKGKIAMQAPGTGNFFVANGAGNSSLTGNYNTASGYYTLNAITTGYSNTAYGAFALNSNGTGIYNTATGSSALTNNGGGAYNTATGASSMYDNETGSQNTATGYSSLYANRTGSGNTAHGSFAMSTNTTGYSNTATGNLALYSNSTGFYNTATGSAALYNNTTGAYNTANGTEALRFSATGGKNAAFGWQALYNNTTGERNTASGIFALHTNSSGYENTALGASADVYWSFLHNATVIGANAVVDASNKVRIGNTWVTSIGGQVGWTTFSDGRYKKDIKENIPGLAFINSLRPVSYKVNIKSLDNYLHKSNSTNNRTINQKEDNDAVNTIQDGFVAQEVEEAAKKLGFEFSGVDKPATKDGLYGLRYDNFVVPLVKAVQELSKINDKKDAKIDSLEKHNIKLEKRIEKLEALMSENSGNTFFSSGDILMSSASLEQNVPNPFNNTTTIRYSLPQKFSSAKIIITDMNGKTIKQINVLGTGKGTLNIDASTLSSGAYNYSLVVDGAIVASKKMIMVK